MICDKCKKDKESLWLDDKLICTTCKKENRKTNLDLITEQGFYTNKAINIKNIIFILRED